VSRLSLGQRDKCHASEIPELLLGGYTSRAHYFAWIFHITTFIFRGGAGVVLVSSYYK